MIIIAILIIRIGTSVCKKQILKTLSSIITINDNCAHNYPPDNQNWNLRLRKVDLEDGGIYECQATTHPPQSTFVTLRVVGKIFLFLFDAFHARLATIFCILFICLVLYFVFCIFEILKPSFQLPLLRLWEQRTRWVFYKNDKNLCQCDADTMTMMMESH